MNADKMVSNNVKTYLREKIELIFTKSIERAIAQQGLKELAGKLKEIVPDITNQYSLSEVKGRYLTTNVRGLHAFQISLVNKIINKFRDSVVLVDIGDSAGTHIQYIKNLYRHFIEIKSLSVNLDEKAINRIRAKGLDAIHARAEDLAMYDISPDIFLCFEILEHLMDPCSFLYGLSSKTKARYLIVTVPYVRSSRVALRHIRLGRNQYAHAEDTHIFELSPRDWKLLIKHAGWSVENESVYFQYPKYNILHITRPLWKAIDYEGFYGLILRRDDTWSSKYKDWK